MMLQGLAVHARTYDGAAHGGTKVVAIGPVPPVSASEYLPRINLAGGAPGAADPGCAWIGVSAVTCATERQLTHLPPLKLLVRKRPEAV
jgi:hypothetical protein